MASTEPETVSVIVRCGVIGEFDQSNGLDFPAEGEIPDVKIDLVLVDKDGNETVNTK